MKLCTLISAFCLLTSVGLGLDVGVSDILMPRGTVDSGQAVIVRYIVANYGDSTGNLWTRVAITGAGGPVFRDSLLLGGLAPAQRETVAFVGWVPRGRDSMTAVAWTECDGDTYPQNDTFRQRFFLRIKDIGLSDLWPSGDAFDSGQIIVPHVRVSNLGNVALFFRLWRDSMILPPGEDTVIYADSLTCMPGIWTIQAFVVVVGDLHPANNLIVDTFFVRGTIAVDVAALAVISPAGIIDTTQSMTPRGRFGNLGNAEASFWAYFKIRGPSGAEIYVDSCPTILSPRDSVLIDFTPVHFSVPGSYTAICSTAMPGDQNSTNDVKYKLFRVVDRISGDVGVTQIVQPQGAVPADSSIIPTAKWKNYWDRPTVINAYFFIHNKHGIRVYADLLLDVPLAAGQETTLAFAEFNVGNDTGRWLARCSTMAGDTNFANDTLDLTFIVACPGIEEGATGEGPKANGGASVLRRLPPGAVAFDAMGRRVLNPKPGVYFVVSEPSAASRQPSAVTVRKVVLAR